MGDVKDQTEDILALVFENHKSLDESSPSGMIDIFRPASGFVASALAPAVKLFTLLHDISSLEAKLKLCRYFQVMYPKFHQAILVWSFQWLDLPFYYSLNKFKLIYTGCYEEEVKKALGRNRK